MQLLEQKDGKLFFEAGFDIPAAQAEETLEERSIDLLGLDSEAAPELLQPPTEMKSSSSNADLLNGLFVSSTPEISEDSTADLLGGGADFFFGGQPQASANAQGNSSSTAAPTSSTGRYLLLPFHYPSGLRSELSKVDGLFVSFGVCVRSVIERAGLLNVT